ncbi:hypothetical protein OF001_U20256 [Pseudomonas sp. OF001]|uniref:hypothetical protein n=1 Tax=Pseudomonas sp. OF001 TaxID=2772300 RepID=UPI00191B6156|nr:hypothetical protein [Pseudomonas sp. OF001]CAD5377329.1 hypothetical protein OF001_U20256 [Pseudomonas sp. OF001]
MNLIARLVVRDEGKDNAPRLILGTLTQQQEFFKKGTVYEVVEMLGEIVIREVGPTCLAGEGETYRDSPIGLHWIGHSVDEVLSRGGKMLFLTRPEAQQVVDQQRAARALED